MSKKVICPVCGKGRIIDVDEEAKVEKLPIEKVEAKKKAQFFYAKCPNCKNIIAVKNVG